MKITQTYSRQLIRKIINEQWKEWNKNTPVQITGVKKAPYIKSAIHNGEQWFGYTTTTSGVEGFDNLKQAQEHFPELNPFKGSKNFTWAMKGMTNTGVPCIRFESWKDYERFSK